MKDIDNNIFDNLINFNSINSNLIPSKYISNGIKKKIIQYEKPYLNWG